MTQKNLRAASMFYDKDGYPVGRSTLSHTDCTTRALCVVLPEMVLPVIFVPGIMGSNLKLNTSIEWFNKKKILHGGLMTPNTLLGHLVI